MTEDLVRSTSSQRSNPRVIRRVRPLPYESCGGVCSLFNSSCFTMCCNGQKTRRRSSVYLPAALARKNIEKKKEEEEKPEEDHEEIEREELEDQISEAPPPKRLIKPDSLDGLTEDELFAFQSRIIIDEDKVNDPIASFDVGSYIPQRAESEENLLEEKVEVKEEIAILTNDTNVPVEDVTDKKKKTRKILDVLKIKKTRSKNKDGLSITSSVTSLAYSEVSEDLVQSGQKAEGIQVDATEASLPMKVEKDDAKAVTENVKEKGKFFTRNLHSVFSSIRRKKDDVLISEAQSSPTLGSKSKSATPSPIAAKSRSGTLSGTSSDWQTPEEDIDRMIQGRGSLSGLGLRLDSMASVYSGAGEGRYGTVAVRGQVEFGLQYNYKAGALEIHVKQCKDLAPVDTKRNRSDPYVKVYLLPDKSKSGRRKTKVKKHTLNPVFDETLKFHISLNGLETRTLWLTVWHSDMFGRNDFLGEVMMSLENKVFDDPAPVWYNLQERTEPFDDTISFKGDIIVCLKFVPPDMTVQKKGKRSRGTLHVLVKEAKYLTAYKANGTSDPFCKSYLLPDKGRNSKQKTPVVKKTVNPVWNHTFIYEDVTLQELAERCLELTVWDHDRLASNEFLGGVRFSLGTGKHYGKPVEWMDATGKEMTLWKSMLERPNFWVEGCLSLRPSLDARTS